MSYAKRSFERSEIRIIDNSRKNLCLPKRMQHAALVGKTKMFSVRGRAEGAIGYRLKVKGEREGGDYDPPFMCLEMK